MLSYEELYEKYATDVLRVSYFYLGDRQRAEDVCQDVFVRLMTNAPICRKAGKRPGCSRWRSTGAAICGAAHGSSASCWEVPCLR